MYGNIYNHVHILNYRSLIVALLRGYYLGCSVITARLEQSFRNSASLLNIVIIKNKITETYIKINYTKNKGISAQISHPNYCAMFYCYLCS